MSSEDTESYIGPPCDTSPGVEPPGPQAAEPIGSEASLSTAEVTDRNHLLRSPSLPRLDIPLPEDASESGLSTDSILVLAERLVTMPIDWEGHKPLRLLTHELSPFLPHQGHTQCVEACGLLMDRQLTAFLLRAYWTASRIHESGIEFDRTHFFLVDIIKGFFRCKDPREVEPIPCLVHRDPSL